MIQSLSHEIGLPVAFDPHANVLQWTDAVQVGETSERTHAQMREYEANPSAQASSDPIYRVWRKMARISDVNRIKEALLRYDITVIPPGFFSGTRKEYFKTAGHYHAIKPGTTIGYPEVYEVISGRAYWIIQEPHSEDLSQLTRIYLIEAGPSEKALIPPGFGHVTINPGDKPLIMANWISDSFTYDYESYRLRRGAGYWVFEGAMPEIVELEQNPNYLNLPDLIKLYPKEIPEFGLLRKTPLYALSENLHYLDFLNRPEDHAELLSIERCFHRR